MPGRAQDFVENRAEPRAVAQILGLGKQERIGQAIVQPIDSLLDEPRDMPRFGRMKIGRPTHHVAANSQANHANVITAVNHPSRAMLRRHRGDKRRDNRERQPENHPPQNPKKPQSLTHRVEFIGDLHQRGMTDDL